MFLERQVMGDGLWEDSFFYQSLPRTCLMLPLFEVSANLAGRKPEGHFLSFKETATVWYH